MDCISKHDLHSRVAEAQRGGSSPRCFGSDSKGVEAAAGLLALLGRCPELQDATAHLCTRQSVKSC